MKKLIVLTVFILIASILAAGCGNKEEAGGVHRMPNGDLQETTASLSALPAFLNGQSQEIRLVYQLAGQVHDTLDWIPCYCGCGQSAGHKSNRDCFIREVKADGTVVWDDHATRCGVCLQIAAQTAQMKVQGKSAKEIRSFIDEKYKQGYAAPTKTPMPM